MQNDFEKWLQVMLKQTAGTSTSAVGQSTLNTSNATFNAGATDKKVSDNLEAFYKARDQIYK